MAVYVTANIYRNRQSCNVGWICVYVYCEGSSASAESSGPYTQIINFFKHLFFKLCHILYV